MPGQIPEPLLQLIAQEMSRPVAAPFLDLARAVRERCGDGVLAVVLYGSCLRAGTAEAGVVDLFVILDQRRNFSAGPFERALLGVLPPSVYYLECGAAGSRLRCKYAVVSLADLESGVCSTWQVYFWARLAQPLRLLYARDAAARRSVYGVVGTALLTFLRAALPLLEGGPLDAESIWRRSLSLTLAAELRPEPAARALLLAHSGAEYGAAVLQSAGPALPGLLSGGAHGWHIPPARAAARRAGRARWLLRRVLGRSGSVLRWIKAAATFSGGVDYAAWKIERHTGVRLEVSERLRRWPLIFGWAVLWKLWRSGALK